MTENFTVNDDFIVDFKNKAEEEKVIAPSKEGVKKLKGILTNKVAIVESPPLTEKLFEIKDQEAVIKNTVLLTGGSGFFGSHIKNALEKAGYNVFTFNSKKYDISVYEAVRAAFIDSKPDFVIHAAGFNGGIEFNRKYPAQILEANIRMSLNVFDACKEFKVKKLVSIISSCAYPDGEELITEDSLFNGRSNDSIAAHSFAKRLLQEASTAYNKQYKLNAVTVAVTNLFGPRANFHPENSKVVEGVISKLVKARNEEKESVEFWGSGEPKRQFMFAPDAAKYVVKALESYSDNTKPLNIGPEHESTIKDLVNIVADIVGYKGEIIWDGRPDGQMRKMLDVSTLKSLFGLDTTSFIKALKETVSWYENEKK